MAKVEMTSYSNKAAPLKAHGQTVMLKLTVPKTGPKNRAPLDIVFVLDTSGSMKGDKLAKMHKAMAKVLVMMDNDSDDRVAIVPFSSDVYDKKYAELARRLKPQRVEMAKFVNGLKAEGNTNIRAGLDLAVRSLKEGRGAALGRTGVIFLMSDGAQNHGDAGKVDVSKVNVQTFGFGEKHDPKLLYALAHQSHGGAYHVVTEKLDANHLADAFLHTLGEFHDISVLNLKVTLKKQGPEIHDVDPGTYPTKPINGGSFTVEFGDLARGAQRRIMLILRLPAVPKPEGVKIVMTAECSYRIAGKRGDTVGDKPEVIKMERTATAKPGDLKPQVLVELLRRYHAASIEGAKNLADKKDFGRAAGKLAQTLDNLDKFDVDHPKSDAVLDFLATEMGDMLDKMGSQEKYDKLGKAFALSALSSHGRQRPTARGKVHGNSLFATDSQLKYLAEARKGVA